MQIKELKMKGKKTPTSYPIHACAFWIDAPEPPRQNQVNITNRHWMMLRSAGILLRVAINPQSR